MNIEKAERYVNMPVTAVTVRGKTVLMTEFDARKFAVELVEKRKQRVLAVARRTATMRHRGIRQSP